MKIKNIIFIFILIMLNINICNADETKKELTILANQVEINYEYLGFQNDEDDFYTEFYKITISNLPDEMYIDYGEDIIYTSDSKDSDGNITFNLYTGEYTFKIYSNHYNNALRTEKILLPAHNQYADSPECKKLKKYNLEACDEWYQGNIDSETFDKNIEKYMEKEDNSILSIIKDNYLYIIGGISILLVLIITIITFKRKRSVLK